MFPMFLHVLGKMGTKMKGKKWRVKAEKHKSFTLKNQDADRS